MYPTTIRIAAATIAVMLLPTVTDARPARPHQPPGWVDVAATPAYPTSRSRERYRTSRQARGHRAARAQKWQRSAETRIPLRAQTPVLVDRPQQYVRPSLPSEKLVTREAHESRSGTIISHKTGARAHVSPKYVHLFQAYIDDLEQNHGARVYYMGGFRKGACSNGSQHPCGTALDVCQDSRGVVSRARECNLPDRAALIVIAAKHKLFEGGRWCDSDMGHVQARPSGSAYGCSNNLFSAVKKYKEKLILAEALGVPIRATVAEEVENKLAAKSARRAKYRHYRKYHHYRVHRVAAAQRHAAYSR